MPRAPMFGDVADPSVRVGARKWYSLPVSIAFHSVIVAAIIIVPIMAPAVLATPEPRMIFRSIDIALPSPPPARAARPLAALHTASSHANPGAAPIEAPAEISPETGVSTQEFPTGVDGGLPDGVAGVGAGIGAWPEPPPPPAAAPARQGRLYREASVTPPTKVKDARPVYPAIARQARVQGTVIIEAIVAANGKVVDVRVLRSIPLLDQAAIDAVRQWEFMPMLQNGVPVSFVTTVTVNFTLQ